MTVNALAIYCVDIVVKTPCGVIGCQCDRVVAGIRSRYVAYSYRPTKIDIIKWEPGLEYATITRKDGDNITWKRRFKRLHAGVNGRRKDAWSGWYNVIP